MDPAPGFRFRAPSEDDLEAVTAVLIADQIASAGTSTLDTDFIRSRWSRPDFDFAHDAWVIVDRHDEVVGYGMVAPGAEGVVGSWGIVRPDQRGRGLGSALFDQIERRTDELLANHADGRFRHAINAGDQAAERLLRRHGLEPLRHFWHMQLDLAGPVTPGPDPAGVEISAIHHPDDLPTVHGILTAAFSEDPSHHPEPFDRWLHEETATPNFDATLWLLARDAGEPVGTLTGSILNGIGWVDYLGVLAKARGRGIGAVLLRRSFAAFADRGVLTVRLSVDAENPTGATALYERVGMRAVWGWDLWERRSGRQATGANARTTEASASTA